MRFGMFEISNIIRIETMVIGKMSLIENIGWNLILSIFVKVVFGFEDPFSCNIIRWMIINIAMSIGVIKCREKNRVRVGCETEGPPQIQ